MGVRTGHLGLTHRPSSLHVPLRAVWAIEESIVLGYLFLVTFGAFRPGEILPITLVVVALAALWLVRTMKRR
jgi:hypothetical protein